MIEFCLIITDLNIVKFTHYYLIIIHCNAVWPQLELLMIAQHLRVYKMFYKLSLT